ncbi:MAG: 2-oxo-4-hydroxy-4-carboxy-5-ureidoimidazoline decarboxylase [Gemmatimonadota bacterium]
MTGGLAGFLNDLDHTEATRVLLDCCGSERWAEEMLLQRPFPDDESVFDHATRIWWNLAPGDWLEAFARHPRIGDPGVVGVAGREQARVRNASAETRRALARANQEYEERFGHVFLICASGLEAEEMLGALRARLRNEPATELANAAEEQLKITRLRLHHLRGKEP